MSAETAARKSKAPIIIAGVAILLVAGGAGYFFAVKSKAPKYTPKKTTRRPVERAPKAGPVAEQPAPKPAGPTKLDILLRDSNNELMRAKNLYDEGRAANSLGMLQDAGFILEKVQQNYNVLVNAYSGREKDRIRNKLVDANQLMKLIHDAKKSAVNRPPPAAPSPPRREPATAMRRPAPPPQPSYDPEPEYQPEPEEEPVPEYEEPDPTPAPTRSPSPRYYGPNPAPAAPPPSLPPPPAPAAKQDDPNQERKPPNPERLPPPPSVKRYLPPPPSSSRKPTAPSRRTPAPAPTPAPSSRTPAPSTPSPSPAPAPVPAPAPRPAPRRSVSPEDITKAIELFKDFIAAPTEAKIEGMKESSGPIASMSGSYAPLIHAIAAYMDSVDSISQVKESPERSGFVALLKKHDPAQYAELGEEEIPEVLNDVKSAIDKLSGPRDANLLQLWGMAHLATFYELGGSDEMIKKYAGALGLQNKSGPVEVIYGTRAGFDLIRLIESTNYDEALAAIKKGKGLSATGPRSTAALVLLENWTTLPAADLKARNVKELERYFKGKVPELRQPAFKHINKILKNLKVCIKCRGRGEIDCTSCKDGRATFSCTRCNGSGRIIPLRGRPMDCRACDKRGRWQDDCPNCGATGMRQCQKCKGVEWSAPGLDEFVSFVDCGRCDGGGLIMSPLKVVCPECHGLGRNPLAP